MIQSFCLHVYTHAARLRLLLDFAKTTGMQVVCLRTSPPTDTLAKALLHSLTFSFFKAFFFNVLFRRCVVVVEGFWKKKFLLGGGLKAQSHCHRWLAAITRSAGASVIFKCAVKSGRCWTEVWEIGFFWSYIGRLPADYRGKRAKRASLPQP